MISRRASTSARSPGSVKFLAALGLCLGWALLVAWGLPTAAIAQDDPPPDTEAETLAPALVRVVSEPSGRSIVLNERRLEEATPTTLELTPGPHSLTVSAEGYQSLGHAIVVDSGEELELTFVLLKSRPHRPTPAELRDLIDPEGIMNDDLELSPEEEAAVRVTRDENSACGECHPLIPKLHREGLHRMLACGECHGAFSEHVEDGRVIGEMSVARGSAAETLCMACHLEGGQSRTMDAVKTVLLPEHMQEKRVRENTACDQCHHVHAPQKWVFEAREIVGLPELMRTLPLLNEEASEETRESFNATAETFLVFPFSLGLIGKAAFVDETNYPADALMLSGSVLVAGSYFLGKVFAARKLRSIRAINEDRKAANARAKEHNSRVDRAMSEYFEALIEWEAESEGRGTVIVETR